MKTKFSYTGGAAVQRLLTLAAAFSLTALTGNIANANDLFNSTLDLIGITSQANPCPLGWTVDASKAITGSYNDGGDSEPWCNVADPGGYGFFFKPFSGDQPSGNLLNVNLYQDNACTPGTKITLSGYASCEPNYCGQFNTNSPAPFTGFFVEFLDASNVGIATNYYNLIGSLPNGGPGTMALFTTPQYTAPAGTVTVRAGATIQNTYSTTGQQNFFVDAFDQESVAPPGSPVITSQPAQATTTPGGNASFGVVATGATSYQWQHANTNLSNGGEFSGATTATLTITGASVNDVGNYRVRVANGSGALFSASAPLALQSIAFYPTVVLTGKLGATYEVDYATQLAPTTWIPMSTNVLTTQPQYFIDSTSPMANTRFYRSVFLH